MRKAVAGALVRLAHRIYQPRVDEVSVFDTVILQGESIGPITLGAGGEGGHSITLRLRGADGSEFDLRAGGGGGGGGTYLPPDDDGAAPVPC
jgi:hypothetical protein